MLLVTTIFWGKESLWMITVKINRLMDQVLTYLWWYAQRQLLSPVTEWIVSHVHLQICILTSKAKHVKLVVLIKLMMLILNDASRNNIIPCWLRQPKELCFKVTIIQSSNTKTSRPKLRLKLVVLNVPLQSHMPLITDVSHVIQQLLTLTSDPKLAKLVIQAKSIFKPIISASFQHIWLTLPTLT